MPHQPLLDLLAAYREKHPEEVSVVDRIVSLVTGHDDCFERTCRPGHLTGSAWVVSADGERHLLMHHRKLGKWLQPGGHADGQTDLAAVARREANEETGLDTLRIVADADGHAALDVDVHDIPSRLGASGEVIDTAHEHHDVRFLLQATEDETLSVNDESHELRWCSPEEVSELTQEPSVLRLLEKARLRLG
ncbi:MAG: NUDIX hydrolase [Planctomycetota bacterium]